MRKLNISDNVNRGSEKRSKQKHVEKKKKEKEKLCTILANKLGKTALSKLVGIKWCDIQKQWFIKRLNNPVGIHNNTG